MAGTLRATKNPGSRGIAAWLAAYRWPLVATSLLVAGIVALGVATYRPDWLPGRGREAANQIVNNIGQKAGDAARTVAGLFDLRSPGERVAGALASLKGKRQPLLHERALPKVRRPLSPLAAIVAAPPPPIETVPLLQAVEGPKPAPGVPVGFTPAPGGPPIVFPGVPQLPGGGGGVILPPPITTTPPPVVIPPTTSGVPEPSSWAMMIIGFALIGGALRRKVVADATGA